MKLRWYIFYSFMFLALSAEVARVRASLNDCHDFSEIYAILMFHGSLFWPWFVILAVSSLNSLKFKLIRGYLLMPQKNFLTKRQTHSEDPGELPRFAAFHLGIHCLSKYP